MKPNTFSFLSVVASVGLLSACATVPMELTNAREAYRRASTGPAAQVAPAEVHVATQALDAAELAFKTNPQGYQTRDLAYVAQRKAEIAEATASISMERQGLADAKDDYEMIQGRIVKKTKQDLSRSRSALAESKRKGKAAAVKFSAEQEARLAADERAAEAHDAAIIADDRAAGANEAQVAANMRADQAAAGETAADKRAAEAVAGEAAADKRASDAQAALSALAAVREDPRGVIVTLSGSVLFASNEATLLPSARERLDEVATVLLTTPERTLIIEGHTDSQGSDGFNRDLSQRRADAVRNYLVACGYKANRIDADGRGEGYPLANNASPEGRANNRRVEIVIERATRTANQ